MESPICLMAVKTLLHTMLKTKLLVNILFLKWLLVYHPLKGQLRDVNDMAVTMENDITDDTAHGDTLL